MTESQIERWMVSQVRRFGGLCYKFTSPGHAGVPDRIVITPAGRIIFVELKSDTGRLSKLQRHEISELQKRDADVRVLKGIKQVKAFVEEVMQA